jgi:hypothetical protein
MDYKNDLTEKDAGLNMQYACGRWKTHKILDSKSLKTTLRMDRLCRREDNTKRDLNNRV